LNYEQPNEVNALAPRSVIGGVANSEMRNEITTGCRIPLLSWQMPGERWSLLRRRLLKAMQRSVTHLQRVTSVLVDGGYTGQPFAAAVNDKLDATVQVAKRNGLPRAFIYYLRSSDIAKMGLH
jgi:hypothetical protein